MSIHYSASTGGFYTTEIHGGIIPSDAVEITAEEHAALLAGQSAGKRIVSDAAGRPVLADPPPPAPPTVEELRAMRAAAYRDEADPLFFKAARGEASMEDWEAKVAEIRERFAYAEGAQ